MIGKIQRTIVVATEVSKISWICVTRVRKHVRRRNKPKLTYFANQTAIYSDGADGLLVGN